MQHAVVTGAGSGIGRAIGERLLADGWRVTGVDIDVAPLLAKSQYGAARAALVIPARSWAKELIARHITVNVVSPAATETAMLNGAGRDVMPAETPRLGRRIRPHEIASLVVHLMSDAAAAVTGQDIRICGGASL